MRWLIVEDALRDRKGHWFEYISTFDQGLRALGDDVTILAERHAEPFILDSLHAEAVLPDSIWHRMSDGAGFLRRYLRVPVHAWQTWLALRHFLRTDNNWDIIFIPTVMVHHLLGWYWLIRSPLRGNRTRVLLFFPNLPLRLEADGTPIWNPSPTTRLMRVLLNGLKPDILAGRVIVGVETHQMRESFARLTGLPVTYFPHPVQPLMDSLPKTDEQTPTKILMACYGPGRPEKGSDVLQEALALYLGQFPNNASRFAFQWIDDFKNDRGEMVELSPQLQSNSRVNVIQRYFGPGEYARHLLETHVMLVPYRCSSYVLRVSRVIIEAMVNGIPVVATKGTTLSAQTDEFGAVVGCEDGSVKSLCASIETAERNYPELRKRAMERMPKARAHFSVKKFRDLLLAGPVYTQGEPVSQDPASSSSI
jgi:glycosyltransferase involved in cell wall biosynthesis